MHPFTVLEAVVALNAGRLVGVPTDTVYGIAADPWSKSGMAALFELKGRGPEHPIALLVADIDQARELCVISGAARRLAGEHWPGPLTMVLPAADGLPEWIGDRLRGTVGVRVPEHPVALELLNLAGGLAVTSANHSGAPPAIDHGEARAVFGSAVAGYLAGAGGNGLASTVLDVTVDPPVVLRAGPVRYGENEKEL
ncbi:MAG: threonylcarbamoyl-AMP synthase [Acidimicrobiia bacterium]|nr:threonylcarbamoyl-AMP synthase [Acidimicrobiia bacterium]NNF09584.1 threonylcarbamoyl-AMP synthase [Acidimicrobiia bacterium]NNL69587.1 threonylcarbamoyl-AMP synthase [Acidimicrobiia bacterium]